jgi:hypothetical protein
MAREKNDTGEAADAECSMRHPTNAIRLISFEYVVSL